MIAFDRILLENTVLAESAEDLKDGGFISKAQFQTVKETFPTLKTHRNVFLRIAFFLLGTFCYSSCTGVFALIFLSAGDHYELMIVLLALLGGIAAELLARQHFYAHGLDDAAICGLLLATGSAGAVLFENTLAVLSVVAMASAVCALRYLHTISVVVCVVCVVGFIGVATFEYHLIPEFYLTIVLFFLATGLFFLHRKLKKHELSKYYVSPLQALQLGALLLGYFSMNYFVVRELAVDMMGFSVEKGSDIPLAYLFYFFTFAIPVLYLVFGIRKRNKLVLWVGLFTFGFSIFTIRYYYHLIPTEWALLLGGLALMATSLFCIRKLKGKETGLTFEKDRMHESNALSLAQAVVVNSHAIQNIPSKGPMEFGGGGFSGGGAGEQF
ncbi:hypothetical protein [Flavobacterium selenitireducens]|uniref:hypothetical protein n=1 Tax=Flavobacterium selenitireducens TaxID=2722704 RepID=UPI00168A6095|nr:hypothetical protein [Flavobacterium selenitireducens]MBD3583727.1 hypothetical protein [Flavobacterium selenitireducens]